MGGSLVHGDLQAVVIGKVLVTELHDLVKVRELAVIGAACLLISRQRARYRSVCTFRSKNAALIERLWVVGARDAKSCRTKPIEWSGGNRRIPPGSDGGLVDVTPGGLVNSVDADVG